MTVPSAKGPLPVALFFVLSIDGILLQSALAEEISKIKKKYLYILRS
jgi:hypothetical protein